MYYCIVIVTKIKKTKKILVLVSNQSTVPVKIDGRQQQEETSALLKTGDQGHVLKQAREFECRAYM